MTQRERRSFGDSINPHSAAAEPLSGFGRCQLKSGRRRVGMDALQRIFRPTQYCDGRRRDARPVCPEIGAVYPSGYGNTMGIPLLHSHLDGPQVNFPDGLFIGPCCHHPVGRAVGPPVIQGKVFGIDLYHALSITTHRF